MRGMLRFRYEQCEPIPLEDVEPATEIVKRFCTGFFFVFFSFLNFFAPLFFFSPLVSVLSLITSFSRCYELRIHLC